MAGKATKKKSVTGTGRARSAAAAARRAVDAEKGLPRTCGKAQSLLVKYYGTENLVALSKASGISRSTLAYWKSCPEARMRKNGYRHIQRIFGSAGSDDAALHLQQGNPNAVALLEVFQEVRDLLSRIEQRLLRIYS
jgi:hypothetical protein